MAAVLQCFELHKAQYDKLPDQKGTLPDVKVARDQTVPGYLLIRCWWVGR